MREIKYLGFLVGERGLRTDPSKVEAICNFPIPSTVKQIRRFLGMAGWYRRFIPNYADITAPITDMLKKGKKILWHEEARLAFEQLKTLLSSAPVLINPDYSKPFYIRCDASTEGVGGVLYQQTVEGDEKPIAYVSQKLNSAQKNYTVTELECLAALVCVKKFRAYIEGYRFTVITDHASLKWLMSQKDLSGRLARWSLKLQAFDFDIQHQKGALNVVPDTLSRVHCDCIKELLDDVKFSISAINLSSECFKDPDYLTLVSNVVDDPQKFPNLQVQNDKLYIRIEPARDVTLTDIPVWKLWVPTKLTDTLIEQEHVDPAAAHGGVHKTLDRIRRFYFWPKMREQITKYVSSCNVCKATKCANFSLRPPMNTIARFTERPFQKIYVDLLGPYPRSKKGNSIILIIVDKLTKFVILKPLANGTADKIVEVLTNDIFLVFGVPETLHTDNGAQFVGKTFQKLIEDFSIRHMKNAIYSPQANASERVNRSIISAIRAYVQKDHRTWDTHLAEIASALRSAIHESAGYSPHFSLFGYHRIGHGTEYKLLRDLHCMNENEVQIQDLPQRMLQIHEHLRSNLSKAYQKYSRYYNLRTRSSQFSTGQVVYVRAHPQSNAPNKFCAKFAPEFFKARIRKPVGNVMYEIEDDKGKLLGSFHAKDIKP